MIFHNAPATEGPPATMIEDRETYAITDLPCRQLDADQADKLYFPDVRTKLGLKREEQAVDLCLDCPLMIQCRTYARQHAISHGVYGGETERERAVWLAEHGRRLLTEWAGYLDTFVPTQRRPKSRRPKTPARVPSPVTPFREKVGLAVAPRPPLRVAGRSTSRNRAVAATLIHSSEGQPGREQDSVA